MPNRSVGVKGLMFTDALAFITDCFACFSRHLVINFLDCLL